MAIVGRVTWAQVAGPCWHKVPGMFTFEVPNPRKSYSTLADQSCVSPYSRPTPLIQPHRSWFALNEPVNPPAVQLETPAAVTQTLTDCCVFSVKRSLA